MRWNVEKAQEYDIFIAIEKTKIHNLCYIVEAEDNLMNLRHVEEDGRLKIIVPGDLLDEALRLLESAKNCVDLEVVEIRENPGHT